MTKLNPKIIVIIGVLFVSLSSILIKLSNAPSLVIATYRLGFTVLLLSPSFVLSNKKEVREIDKKSLILCIVSGIFLALHFATWVTSIKYTSISSSTVLVNTHPIFIILGTYFIFKEKISRNSLISIAIALVGSVIISSGDSSLGNNALFGDILSVLGGFFVAGYMMIGKVVRQRLSVTSYTFLVYLSCTITLLLFDFVSSTPIYPYSIREIIIFLCLALFCTILGHSIFNWSLGYVKPTFLSTSILGEPVFATLWAFLIFGEAPALWNIVGSLFIISGIFLFTQSDREIKKSSASEEKIVLE